MWEEKERAFFCLPSCSVCFAIKMLDLVIFVELAELIRWAKSNDCATLSTANRR